MTDAWSTPVVTFDHPSYIKGALITMTISNVVDTETVTSNLPNATGSVLVTAADGSTVTVAFSVPPISQTIVSTPAVTAPATVTDSSGRIWTLQAGSPSGTYVYTATA